MVSNSCAICLITSMITDRIRWHEVLLPINHNRYNSREKNAFFLVLLIPNGKLILPEETLCNVTNSSILENLQGPVVRRPTSASFSFVQKHFLG